MDARERHAKARKLLAASTDPMEKRKAEKTAATLGGTRIAIAKKAGVYKGRKSSLTPERVAELHARISAGEKKAALAREFGISRETLYQYAPVNG